MVLIIEIVKELCTLALVCRDIKILAMDDSLWMKFFMKIDYIADNLTPPARVCHSAVVYRDSMYIYGGHIPDALNYIRDVKNDFYGYNFETRQWSVVGLSTASERMPLKTEHTSVVYKNCMYMFGGYADSAVGYSDVAIYEYNFDSHTCSRIEAKGKAPPDRSAHTAVVYKDSMYVLGGWDGNMSNNDFYVFHFKSHTWEEVKYAGIPPPCVRSHSSVVYKDSMVVFGGYGIDNHPTSIFIFHFLEERWEVIKPSLYPPKFVEEGSYPHAVGPRGRSRFRMVCHHESLWVVGGWDRKSYFADVWRFRFDTRAWHKVDVPFEFSGVGQHSLVVNKGRMYLYGGYCSDSKTPHPHLYVFRLPKVYNAEA